MKSSYNIPHKCADYIVKFISQKPIGSTITRTTIKWHLNKAFALSISTLHTYTDSCIAFLIANNYIERIKRGVFKIIKN